MKALEVEQKQGPKATYWRVRTESGWANSFTPVEVGQEGELVTKGKFTNFVPISQPSEQLTPAQDIEIEQAIRNDLKRIEQKLDILLENFNLVSEPKDSDEPNF